MIVVHRSLYSQDGPDYYREKSIRDLLEPYFHRVLVDVVSAGHSHDFGRLITGFSGNAMTFLVVGGAGGGSEPEGENSECPQMNILMKKTSLGNLEVKKNESKGRFLG